MTAQSVALCEGRPLFQALPPRFSQNVKVLDVEIQNTKIPLLVTKSGSIFACLQNIWLPGVLHQLSVQGRLSGPPSQ